MATSVGLLLFKYWPGMTSYSSKLNLGLAVMFTGTSGFSPDSILVSSSLARTVSLARRQTKRKSSRTRMSWRLTRARQRPQNSHSQPVNESQPAGESQVKVRSNGRDLTSRCWTRTENSELRVPSDCHNIIKFLVKSVIYHFDYTTQVAVLEKLNSTAFTDYCFSIPWRFIVSCC